MLKKNFWNREAAIFTDLNNRLIRLIEKKNRVIGALFIFILFFPFSGSSQEKNDIIIFPDPETGVTSAKNVNVRSGPGLDRAVAGIIKDKGTGIIIIGSRGDWYKIKIKNRTGWIYKKFVLLDKKDLQLNKKDLLLNKKKQVPEKKIEAVIPAPVIPDINKDVNKNADKNADKNAGVRTEPAEKKVLPGDVSQNGNVSQNEDVTQNEDSTGLSGQPAPYELNSDRSDELKRLFEKVKELDEEVQRLRQATDIRKKLEITDEEKKAAEKEILTTAGRQYLLAREGTLELEYNGSYYYTSSNRLEMPLEVKHVSNHTFRNTITAEYAIRNNFTVNINVPFVYKYDKVGSEESIKESGIGNISAGFQWQPFKAGASWPTTIFFMSYSADTGSSPYEVTPGEELSTADGFDSIMAGLSLSKSIDPVVGFGTLVYTYNNDPSGLNQNLGGDVLEKVETGDEFGFSLGIGYSLSYKVSLNLQYQHTYRLRSKYFYKGMGLYKSTTSTSSIFSIGTGWRVTPKQSIHISLGIGLTNDVDDFILSIRVPFSFRL